MSLLLFKFIAALSIFALTLAAGLLPLRFALHNKKVLHLGDAFASGIFLSAALLHLLPDSEIIFSKFYGVESYPFAQLLCVVTFVVLLVMERGIAMYGKSHSILNNGKNYITSLLLILVLSIHSFVEGAAIGIGGSFAEALIIYLAVIVHKGSESLALFSNLYRNSNQLRSIGRTIIIFACMTPLGILLASFIQQVFNHNSGQLLEAIFNAMAAGTFLYLGTVHVMECEQSFEDFSEMCALVMGVALMAVVAIWV